MLSTIFVYTKDAVTLLMPFYLINLFFKIYYQTNIFSVASWWFKYHSEMEYKAILFLGTSFLFFIYFVAIGGLVQKLSLSIQGETHALIYVGDSAPATSNFVKQGQLDAKKITYEGFSGSSPFSFANIYREILFLRDSGTDRIGSPAAAFSFAGLFVIALWALSLMPTFLGALHSFGYPVSIKAENMDFVPIVPASEAFMTKFPSLKLTPFKLIGFTLVMAFLAILFSIFMPSSKKQEGKRAINLPRQIKPGYEVQGLPINLKRDIYESTSSTDIDTGYRTIIFKFEKDFPTPVYVSYYYDSKEHPYLEELTGNNIEKKQLMNLTILDDLSLDILGYD